MERRIEEERARVEFEKRIRESWHRKCRAKNERIAELERRIEEDGLRGG